MRAVPCQHTQRFLLSAAQKVTQLGLLPPSVGCRHNRVHHELIISGEVLAFEQQRAVHKLLPQPLHQAQVPVCGRQSLKALEADFNSTA